jgi:hypothetical protein
MGSPSTFFREYILEMSEGPQNIRLSLYNIVMRYNVNAFRSFSRNSGLSMLPLLARGRTSEIRTLSEYPSRPSAEVVQFQDINERSLGANRLCRNWQSRPVTMCHKRLRWLLPMRFLLYTDGLMEPTSLCQKARQKYISTYRSASVHRLAYYFWCSDPK